ncbi:DUF3473 domain-containing protein [Paludibacter sp.]
MKILTFDIEEWYHLLDNESTKTEKEWNGYEVRIHQNMDRILEVLEKTNTKATFFVVGWIAEKFPEVIKTLADKGYDIGSHSNMHQLVYDLSPKGFEQDIERSIKTLEDISGKKVRIFRAPGFSITEKNKWAFEVMAKYGIEVDCSVFPANHAHGGFPALKQSVPSMLHYNGISLKEFPINHIDLFGEKIIFSGGGYFRLFPYFLTKHWTQQADYLMSYLHPRDFDATQPMIEGLSPARKFKSYVGLKSSTKKLEQWLTDFDFIDLSTAERLVNWDEVPKIEL